MGTLMILLNMVITLVVVLIVVAILRPIYAMKELEPGIYENRISFWKYIGTSVVITIVIYVILLLFCLFHSRKENALIL